MTKQEKGKAPAGTRASNQIEIGNIKMINNSLPDTTDFDTKFILKTGHARVWVQSQNVPNADPVVELTDDFESNLLLTPAEALSLAAALQSVAVHLMEEPRTLTRKTEPGAPQFEEGI